MPDRIIISLTGTHQKCDPLIIKKLTRILTDDLGLVKYTDVDNPEKNIRTVEFGNGKGDSE